MSGVVEIFTDGSVEGNPGPGGYAAVLRSGDDERVIDGYVPATTSNQRMELLSAIKGLQGLKRPSKVKLYSDSAYLVNGMSQRWIEKWRRNGWKNSRKEPVANRDLWDLLDEAASGHEIAWVKVKGHADNEGNNKAHALAYAAARRSSPVTPSAWAMSDIEKQRLRREGWPAQSIEDYEKFGYPVALLYKLKGERVMTPLGEGVLVHPLSNAGVILDKEERRARRAKPTGTKKYPGEGKAVKVDYFDFREVRPLGGTRSAKASL